MATKRTAEGAVTLTLTVSGDGRGFLTVGGDAVGYATTSARKDGTVLLVSAALPLANIPASMADVTPHYNGDLERWETALATWTVTKRPKGTWSPPRRHEVPPTVAAVTPRTGKAPAPEGLASLLADLTPADRKALRAMLK